MGDVRHDERHAMGNPVWTCFWFFELCVEEHSCCLTALNHSQKRDRLGWTWWHLRVIPTFWRLRQKADAVKAILIYLVKLSQQEREQRAATGVPCPDPVPFHCLYPFLLFPRELGVASRTWHMLGKCWSCIDLHSSFHCPPP